MTASCIRLKDPSLLVGQNYIQGRWLEAENGTRFNVMSERMPLPFTVVFADLSLLLSKIRRMGTSLDLAPNRTQKTCKKRSTLQPQHCQHGALGLVVTVVASCVDGTS